MPVGLYIFQSESTHTKPNMQNFSIRIGHNSLLKLCIFFLIIYNSFEDPNLFAKQNNNKLLLIVLDGFRWNYATLYNNSGLSKIINRGSMAHHLAPVFPTKALPNLYSIVTGLYPENHGFVSDVMYNHIHGTFFYSPSSTDSEYWWNETEPIWITATEFGKRAAVYMWPGCHIPIKNIKPQICQSGASGEFDGLVFENHLRDSLNRMAKNEIDFALVYTEHYDVIGHQFGPNSNEMTEAVKQLSVIIDDMDDAIQNNTILQKNVNVVIMSDYGMTDYPKQENQHSLTEVIELNDIQHVTGSGTDVGVYPKAGKLAKVYMQLHQVSWATVWKRNDIPESFHIKWHNHTAPILLIAKPGHVILPISDSIKQVPPEQLLSRLPSKGTHGYDPNEVSDMNGIFFIYGPAFKKNVTKHEISIVDVYNMMTCVLNITAHPNNGSWTNICSYMNKSCNGLCNFGIATTESNSSLTLSLAFLSTLISIAITQ